MSTIKIAMEAARMSGKSKEAGAIGQSVGFKSACYSERQPRRLTRSDRNDKSYSFTHSVASYQPVAVAVL